MTDIIDNETLEEEEVLVDLIETEIKEIEETQVDSKFLKEVLEITTKVSMPAFSKADTGLASELAGMKDADNKSLSVSKKLFDKETLKPLTSAKRDIIAVYDRYLHPWGKGTYVVPVKDVQKFITDYDIEKKKFDNIVDDFTDELSYSDAVEAQRERLGDTFDITNFPAPSEVKEACHTFYSISDLNADLSNSGLPPSVISNIMKNNEKTLKDQKEKLERNLRKEILDSMNSIKADLEDADKKLTGHSNTKIKTAIKRIDHNNKILGVDGLDDVKKKLENLNENFNAKEAQEDQVERELITESFSTIFNELNGVF